jgi:hypothetical protein
MYRLCDTFVNREGYSISRQTPYTLKKLTLTFIKVTFWITKVMTLVQTNDLGEIAQGMNEKKKC